MSSNPTRRDGAVQERDARLREVLDALPAAVYETDREGWITYSNAAAAELFGRTPGPGTDRWCASRRLFRADGTPLPHAECPMAIALREGRAVRGVELIVEKPDGTRIACMSYPTPLRAPDGTITGAINLLVDISGEKRLEDELGDSERRFMCFMDNLPGLAWIKDRDGRYVYANESAEKAFDTPIADLVGRTDDEVFPPGTAAEFIANDREALARDTALQTIETLEHSDGSIHYSIVSKFPIPGRDGRTVMVGGVALDVTALKQAQEALRRSEAWFRTLAEASPALIWRLDPDGSLAYVNPTFLEYFGRREDDILNEGWRPLLHPDDADCFLATVEGAQHDRSRLQATARVKHRQGGWCWIESHALPLFSDPGEYLGHIGISLDVTERKEYEHTLSEADARKDQFLAMLAHELRSPLAPIRNSIEILRRMAAPGTGPVMDTLERQVRQLVRLVDDLLDVSRISRGRIELRRERVDLCSTVQHAVEAVQPLCDAMGQALSVTLPADEVWLHADPARIGQVLGNLLSNASKFSDRGGRISLEVKVDGAWAAIRVADEGVGIAPEQITRIFDLFAQVDTTSDRAAAGLGIGLTLVQSLVGMHGGTVEVSSAGIGCGSEFIVRLPLADKASEPVAAAAEIALARHELRRILVVDDNRDSADSLALLLRLAGHETATAYDGLQAVEAATRFRPDVILLDIGLPRINGLEAARRIRQLQADRRPMIVALTGWGQDADRRASQEAGFDAHLVKPVDDATLARLLAQRGNG
jgi:PAS domain S-box-containing protein